MICLAEAFLPKGCGVLMPLFARIDAYKSDSWCLVFSTGRVSLAVRDLLYFNVREMGSSEPHGTAQSRQKSRFFPDLLTCFQAEGETFPSLIVIADEAWVHNFEPETKRQSVYCTIQICPEEKLQKFSVSG